MYGVDCCDSNRHTEARRLSVAWRYTLDGEKAQEPSTKVPTPRASPVASSPRMNSVAILQRSPNPVVAGSLVTASWPQQIGAFGLRIFFGGMFGGMNAIPSV